MNPWASSENGRSMQVLERNADQKSKDRHVLRKLAVKLSRVPPARPDEQTREQREAEVWWHREQLLRFFQVHRKRLRRLGVRLEDFFQRDGTVAYKDELPEVPRTHKHSDGGKTSALSWLRSLGRRLLGRGR